MMAGNAAQSSTHAKLFDQPPLFWDRIYYYTSPFYRYLHSRHYNVRRVHESSYTVEPQYVKVSRDRKKIRYTYLNLP